MSRTKGDISQEMVLFSQGFAGDHVAFVQDTTSHGPADLFLLEDIWQSLGKPEAITVVISAT